MVSPENTAFIFGPGSHHGNWIWGETARYVREESGYSYENVGLDLADERLDFKDYASPFISYAIDFAEEGKKSVVIDHSRMVNSLPWQLRHRNIIGAISVCGSFQTEILKHLTDTTPGQIAKLPAKYHMGFDRAPVQIDNQTVTIPPAAAKHYFYSGIENADEYAKRILAQRQAKIPDELFPWPREEPVLFIHGNQDQVIDPRHSIAIARLFGVESEGIDTGHMPMLEDPKQLGKMIVGLAARI